MRDYLIASQSCPSMTFHCKLTSTWSWGVLSPTTVWNYTKSLFRINKTKLHLLRANISHIKFAPTLQDYICHSQEWRNPPSHHSQLFWQKLHNLKLFVLKMFIPVPKNLWLNIFHYRPGSEYQPGNLLQKWSLSCQKSPAEILVLLVIRYGW